MYWKMGARQCSSQTAETQIVLEGWQELVQALQRVFPG